MTFWKYLRWTLSALFVLLALAVCAYALLDLGDAQPKPSAVRPASGATSGL